VGRGHAQSLEVPVTFEESISNDALIVVGHLASVQSFDRLPAPFDSTQIEAEIKVNRVLKNITSKSVTSGDNVRVTLHLENRTLANVTTNQNEFIWGLQCSDHLWGGVSSTNEISRVVAEIRRQAKTSSNKAAQGTARKLADPGR
jgi:hypothetical protein